MGSLIVIQTAETDWRAQGRLAGDIDLPLNENGHREAVQRAQAVRDFAATVIRGGPEEATRQTAEIIAHELGLKSRVIEGLRELNLGHWEGLTDDEFRERFPKIRKQWRNESKAVSPPEGESVSEAEARLVKAIDQILRRNNDAVTPLVLGPFAAAIVRCHYGADGFGRFWEYVDGASEPVAIELPPLPAAEPPARRRSPKRIKGLSE